MKVDIRALSRAYYKDISKTLIAERKVRKLPDFEPDNLQRKIIESKAKHLRVVAPAGSGKTQTLTAKAVEILNGQRRANILCLTFTNAAADEFRAKASKLSSAITQRLSVSTVNSFGYEILRGLNEQLQVITPSSHLIGRVYGCIKAQMAESDVWGGNERYDLYQAVFELADLTKTLGFNHQSGNDAARSDFEFVENLGLLRPLEKKLEECEIVSERATESDFLNAWFPFWQELTQTLWDKNIISLEDQKYWALDQLTSNPRAVSWLLKKKITHLFVDEFQDINILDLYLIALVLEITKSDLVIVGDDDQCIYEWRGCTSAFIRYPDLMFGQVLNGREFEKIELEQNYRCPRNIVEYSSNLISNNEERIIKRAIPKRKDDANIRVVPLAAAYMTMNVVDELVGFLSDKHPDHSVAIVGRKKSQLIPIQILLTKRGVRFKVDTDLNVFAGEAFRDLRRLLELPAVYNTPRRAASENIADILALLDRAFRTRLSKDDKERTAHWLKSADPKSLKLALLAFGRYPHPFRKGYSQPAEVALNLHQFLDSKSVVECLLKAGDLLQGFKKDFNKSKDEIFYSEPPFSHLADLSVNYENDFEQFLTDIDTAIARAHTDDPRSAKIELMTALRTKGREFDTVIVLDANDGIFPNKISEKEGRIEEERRLFYVTVTRAKNNLLLFDSRRINGRPMLPTRFIKEMKLPKSCWLENPQLDRISNTLLRELKI